MNKSYFYYNIRPSMFGGKLKTKQVQNIEAILNEWETRQIKNIYQLAYILATVYHETAGTMQPIEEYGKGAQYDYGKKLDIGAGPGKRIAYNIPDKLFYGRGHTQNTWLSNYRKLTAAAKAQGKDWDFVNNPELLLLVEPSIWATFHGMTTGLYTGKKLSDYFNKKNDPVGARKIINGLDQAAKIAGYYNKFLQALTLD